MLNVHAENERLRNMLFDVAAVISGAKVVQRDATLRGMQAELDAARAEVARLTAERAAMLNVKTTEGLTASEWLVRTAKAEAEVARLKEEVEGAYEAHNEAVTILERRLETYKEAADDVLKALPAVAINEMEEILCASNTALVRKALAYLWHCAAREALRKPAPAQPTAPERLYGKYRISKADSSPTDPEAEYFVLRIDTDPAARAAVAAYADYITFSAPEFCDDLRQWLARVPLKPAPAQGQE